ncbi:N-6 DNA methylase [Coleofasciculus sp. E2-BRE-01]|uniref:N-6 DNA methylase n=1 Tax=Coleofasciculus sp. E2-BRE-01 TaxID=3069524 RepID=UPI0032FB6F76
MIEMEDLERAIESATDLLRGAFGVRDYKKYLFRLLLLKRLSDVFEEEAERIERETADHDLAWNEPSIHRFFVPKNSRWSYLQHLNGYDIGNEINKVARSIEGYNSELEGVFTSVNFEDAFQKNAARNSRNASYYLVELIQHISRLSFRNSNLKKGALGELCEDLIEKDAADAGKRGGEFYTPSQVKKLLVRLLKPQEKMSICDPVCGTAGFLVECVSQLKQQKDNPNNLLLYGQEANYETWVIAKINLLLHDIFEFDIRLGDVINEPQLIQNGKLMQFDRVIANPPFNIKNWGYENAKFFDERFHYGIPPKSSGDFAFIQHILFTLNSTGRAGIVVAPGVLFRGGSEGSIRKGIIEDDLIEAVIGLAPNLFYSTGIPCSIVIFNRNKSANRKGKILFVDAKNEFQKDRPKNNLSDQHLDHIVTVYRDFRDEEEYSKVVSIDEIAANDYTLNISRYVLPSEVVINFDAEIKRLGNKLLKLDTELAETERKINKFIRELGGEI